MPRPSSKKAARFSPNSDQLASLLDYAAWAGADWRTSLRCDWMRAGSAWPGEWAYLQQLRNEPAFDLAAFELKVPRGMTATQAALTMIHNPRIAWDVASRYWNKGRTDRAIALRQSGLNNALRARGYELRGDRLGKVTGPRVADWTAITGGDPTVLAPTGGQ